MDTGIDSRTTEPLSAVYRVVPWSALGLTCGYDSVRHLSANGCANWLCLRRRGSAVTVLQRQPQLTSMNRSNEATVAGYVNEAGTGTTVEIKSESMASWQRLATRYVSSTQAFFEAALTLTLTKATGLSLVLSASEDCRYQIAKQRRILFLVNGVHP